MCVASLGLARKQHSVQMRMPPAPDSDGDDSDEEPPGFVAPAMPCIMRPPGFKPRHRPKIPDCSLPFPACVARPVNKTEIAVTPAAQRAMDLEWKKLVEKEHPCLLYTSPSPRD